MWIRGSVGSKGLRTIALEKREFLMFRRKSAKSKLESLERFVHQLFIFYKARVKIIREEGIRTADLFNAYD